MYLTSLLTLQFHSYIHIVAMVTHSFSTFLSSILLVNDVSVVAEESMFIAVSCCVGSSLIES